MKRYDCDLHCHTVRSDGKDTPAELIEKASKYNMKVIAITDHDIQPPSCVYSGGTEIEIRAYAAERGIEIVLGYEFSCDTYVDDVHILGYKLDWRNGELIEEVERAKKSKSEAYKELCDLLTKRGMPIDYEKEILTYIDERGQIRHRDPKEVQRKHIFEVMAQKGYAPSWKDAKILVRDDQELNVRRKKIHPYDALSLIKKCNGVAVLAHPFLIDEVIKYPNGFALTREEYIQDLIKRGLNGIEARYPYSKTSYKGELSDEIIEMTIRESYTDKVSFFTGGSDYHGEDDRNMKNARFLGEKGIYLEEFKKIRDFLI